MATKKEIINHFINTMDITAQMEYGEFGYDTCTKEQQREIIEYLFDLDLIH